MVLCFKFGSAVKLVPEKDKVDAESKDNQPTFSPSTEVLFLPACFEHRPRWGGGGKGFARSTHEYLPLEMNHARKTASSAPRKFEHRGGSEERNTGGHTRNVDGRRDVVLQCLEGFVFKQTRETYASFEGIRIAFPEPSGRKRMSV